LASALKCVNESWVSAKSEEKRRLYGPSKESVLMTRVVEGALRQNLCVEWFPKFVKDVNIHDPACCVRRGDDGIDCGIGR
jgi:hypothetical protein